MYHFAVIRRFYVHNFRCKENFDLPISGQSSVLLIGKNGTGKTTVALALEKLQRIARGTNRVGDLVKPADFSYGRAAVPMRFEIEVELESKVYAYTVAFELPEGFRELRVFEEKLTVDGTQVYRREKQNVHLFKSNPIKGMKRFPDRRLVLLLDFDQDEGRRGKVFAEIPDDLKNRVFVLGVWSEPEDLRRDLHISLEAIGRELAEACLANEFETSRWHHPLLSHNASELNRLRQSVRPILFA